MTVVKACTRLTRLYGKYLLCPYNILFNSARLSHHCVCMNINRSHQKKEIYMTSVFLPVLWPTYWLAAREVMLTMFQNVETAWSIATANIFYMPVYHSFIHSLETQRCKLNIMNFSIICYEMCLCWKYWRRGFLEFCYTGLHAQCYLRSLTHIMY